MEIAMQRINKSFGNNNVLKGVDFRLAPGEIHALMGENGAGKSTLMNILTGIISSDSGQIEVDGQKTQFKNALVAEQAGISFIHQEMNNYGEMTVLENMFINRELTNRLGLLKTRAMWAQARQYLDYLGAEFGLDTLIKDLSVGNQQLVEIAKSLMTNAQVIIMDEPTSALTENEIQKLFKIVKELQQQGVGFIYISHRMEEIFALCDTITVMRDGISVMTTSVDKTNVNQIVKAMVGRELTEFYPTRTNQIGDIYLQARGLSRRGVFNDINFDVRSGEIVAFAGLMGAGRTEIMRAIFGLDHLDRGKIIIRDQLIENHSPAAAIKHGIGFVTENRKDEGLMLDATIADNIDLASLASFTKYGVIDQHTDRVFVDKLIKRLTIKAQSALDIVNSLSGGNQQKVVLAKWIGAGSQVLILDEPTRGVDVGAKREIYDLMNELTARGVAILMISSDLPEVLGMSDRINVVYEGHINGTLQTKDATQEAIMTLATGGQINE